MSLGCFNIINSYPSFGSHAKKGIDNYHLHPFTLLLVEVPVRTNDHQFDRSSDIFFGLSANKIKYKVKYCYATDLQWRWVWGPPSQKIGFFSLNLKMKDPESIAGKIIVEYSSKAGS